MSDYLSRIRGVGGVDARFLERVDGVSVCGDRLATVARLEPFHREAVGEMGYSWDSCWRAEQVHGAEVAVVGGGGVAGVAGVVEGVDGLITVDAGVLLGIYVADCGAIYLADRVTGAVGLLHSGKRGTELGILGHALGMMGREFGTDVRDVEVALAPCIRPPAYEVDFADEIRLQAMEAGVREESFMDSGVCTSSDLGRYYSYRVERGATGRMLALLGRSGE